MELTCRKLFGENSRAAVLQRMRMLALKAEIKLWIAAIEITRDGEQVSTDSYDRICTVDKSMDSRY